VVDGEVRELGEVRYLLSPQDLAAVDMIPQLVKAGVKSYKIEGRLKSPEYVTAVTRVYRKALDAAVAGLPSPVDAADRYAMEMTFSRGLTTGWLAGTNHPYLTHGRFGKKRGPLLGTIGEVGAGWVRLKNRTDVPIAAGDGVVFDAGEDRNREQGGRIWKLEKDHLVFHRTFGGVDFERVRVGQTLYKTSDPKLDSELRRFWQNAKPQPKRMPLVMTVEGAPGEPMVLTAVTDGARARVVSPVPIQLADRHALDDATLAAQLGRLGDTCFVLDRVENRLQGACHLPLSVLNQMRREVVADLDVPVERQVKAAPKTTVRDLLPERPDEEMAEPVLSVLCRSDEQLGAVIEAGVSTVYLDYEDPRRYRDAVARFRSEARAGAEILLATPRILKPGEDGYLKLIERAGPHGMLLRNLAALNYYKNRSEFRRVGDFSLNVANPVTARMLMEGAALDWLTVSYDLNIGQALELLHAAPAGWFELTLHQHMPMFHMEHCVFCVFLSKGTTYKDCGRPCEKHVVHLRDRVGQLHRLQADVGCRNTLFNGRAQTGARFFAALRQSGLRRFRVELLDEDSGAAARTIQSYQDLLAGRAAADEVLGKVGALEKLGVTEGTLVENE
jgi:putative protease